jgi:hypothetical protein
MPKVLTVVAVLAAIVLLAASSTMNYLFASSLGRSTLEGIVLGVVAVGVDVLKAVLAVVLAVAARDRRWGFFVIGGFAFVLFSALSLTASFGFSASNRSAVFGERDRQTGKLVAAEARIGDLRTKLKSLPAYRPLPVVEEAIAAGRSQSGWFASKQCTVLTKTSREFCDALNQLRTERATALEGNRLEDLLAVREAEAETLRGAGSGLASDPQAKALASSIGIEEGQVQRGLMALLALVLEVSSGFGVYLALGHGLGKKADKREGAETQTLELRNSKLHDEPAPKVLSPPVVAVIEPPPPADQPPAAVSVSVRTPSRTRRNGASRLEIHLPQRGDIAPEPDDTAAKKRRS